MYISFYKFRVANGMDFLTERTLYRGDLAARNFLVTDTFDVKISDFGLSKRLNSEVNDPVSLKTDEDGSSVPLPVKWFAI
jgi:serine/threonine protein kinase